MQSCKDRRQTRESGARRILRGLPSVTLGFSTMALGLVSPALWADNYYTVNTSVFSEFIRRSSDAGSATGAAIGAEAAFGADIESGAHNFFANYGARVKAEEDSVRERGRQDITAFGASRYNYFNPGERFDFNAGHTVRSVRDEAGFSVDPSRYGTQNSVTAGAGFTVYPGDVTSLRFSTQGGRSFEDGPRPDSESLNARADLTRRLTERTDFVVGGGRTWASDESPRENTELDNVEAGFDSRLENGSFSIRAGGSQIRQGDTEDEAVTGSAVRTWNSEWSSTSVAYQRQLTSTALELTGGSLGIPFAEDETFRLEGNQLRQTVSISHSNTLVCDVCRLRLRASAEEKDFIDSDEMEWNYRAGVGMGFDITNLTTMNVDYLWQADAFEERSQIDDQIHRVFVGVTRDLTERASVGVSATQSITRGINDQERFVARLSFNYNWGTGL